jgi:hypothetical protein
MGRFRELAEQLRAELPPTRGDPGRRDRGDDDDAPLRQESAARLGVELVACSATIAFNYAGKLRHVLVN